ncbi:hypothetical protein OQA88_4903 [Cercophora sp. LCS_1]
MASSSRQCITAALRSVRRQRTRQWQPLDLQFQTLRIGGTIPNTSRCLSTDSHAPDDAKSLSPPAAARADEDLSSSTIKAALPIDFSLGSGSTAGKSVSIINLPNARPVPASPSYFSRQPNFHDSVLSLEKLLRSHGGLPTVPLNEAERVAWKGLEDYRQTIGERVRATDYSALLTLVKRLHRIHPALKPREVTEALEEFKREIQPFDHTEKEAKLDRFGRSHASGRRKSATARAYVVEGMGEVQVNGKSLADYFGRVHDRESAIWALQASNRLDKYNVWATVEGGGTTGQAEALTLAIAKALLVHEPALKPALRQAGCVTRDMRRVERKKHGHNKARKSPTWVKR